MNHGETSLLRDQIRQLREEFAALRERNRFELDGMWRKLATLEAELEKASEEEPVPSAEANLPVAETAPPAVEPVAEPLAESAPLPSPPPFPAQVPSPPRPASSRPVPAREAPPAAPAVPPAPKDGSFELRFGRIWLVRVGIALLVTGLVLLGNYAYKNWIRDLAPAIRLAALYAGSLMLTGGGVYFSRRDGLRRFGEVLIAGGMAFFYWCTFAAHHVPRLRVVESPVVAGLLLVISAAAIVAVSLRRNSQTTAVMGLLLASYATMLQPLGWLSAASNLMLAGTGTALLLRPGWKMPGIAAMAGTYASFFGWQILGAAGGRPQEPAALWFLPPVWAMFALPGIFGLSNRFASFSERGRAAFASANNGTFFGLFSLVWLEQRPRDDYWMVAAVFGAVLLGLGALSRRRDAAGGSHLAQGLGALTLAIVLKLEGYHLALALAVQSLGLALAYVRFRGKSELAFSTAAAVGGLVCVFDSTLWARDLPVWSSGVTALLLTAAAFFLSKGRDAAGTLGPLARAAVPVVFFAGSLTALGAWCPALPEEWRAPAAAAIATAMAAFTLLGDPAGRLEEAALAAPVFLLAALAWMIAGGTDMAAWSPAPVALLSLAMHWLGLRYPAPPSVPGGRKELARVLHWLSALAVTAALYRAGNLLDLPSSGLMLWCAAGAIVLAALARLGFRSPALAIAAVLLLPLALMEQLAPGGEPWIAEFLPLLASLAVTGIALLPRERTEFRAVAILARCCTLISWFTLWDELAPDELADILAASGLALLGLSLHFRRILPESGVLLAAGISLMLVATTGNPWGPVEPAPFPHGWMAVLAGLATAFLLKGRKPHALTAPLFLFSCALLTLWSTQLVVWHFGWKPVAVLWTGLGFVLVSGGLWRKIAALRYAGFALLAMALGKLFTLDVWDFTTFTRVAAFLALGAALVVLGFFYNRFADVLKKLFESEET